MSRWLDIPERQLHQKQLEKLGDEWQHRLGLCNWAFKYEAVPEVLDSRIDFASERLAVIRARDERRLVHELLHALFWRRNLIWRAISEGDDKPKAFGKILGFNEQVIVFQLTNALLRLKYGD